MLRNYLLIAWRNLLKNKVFSFINIAGLAIGIAICLLLLQFISFEKSFDRFHEDKEELYRVRLDRYNNGELSTQWAAGSAAVGFALQENFPEMEDVVTMTGSDGVVKYEDKIFREKKVFYATAPFFSLFSYELLQGDPKTVLADPYKAVISESFASRYFGDQDPIGKQIKFNETDNIMISGIVADVPANSHLQFELLLSFETILARNGPEMKTYWQWDGFLTYVKVKAGTNMADLTVKLNDYVKEVEKDYLTQANHRMDFSFQPVTDIHLYSDFMAEAGPNGNGESVSFLSIIAVFILLIAWVNYINLSTARSSQRAREVGMRKTSGATRTQLIFQFLLESLLLNVLAGIIALTLYQLGQQAIMSLTGIPPESVLWAKYWFWPVFIGIILLGACLSGLYPAFVLSSFRPAWVLKGSFSGLVAQGNKINSFFSLRKGLVVFQFLASVLLITGTLAVYQQLTFMRNHDLGINVDQILVVKGPEVTDSTLLNKLETFRTNMLKNPNILEYAMSNSIPGDPISRNAGDVRRFSAPPSEGRQYLNMYGDRDFIDLYGLNVIAGRKFADEVMRDTSTVVFNQSAVRQMGFKELEEAIGEEIYLWGQKLRIIGVVEDFHIKSMKELTRPTIIQYAPYITAYQSMKVQTEDLDATLAYISDEYAHAFPGNPCEYFFVDEYFDSQYKSDVSFGKVFGLFTTLAILVACMGLFGLASFTIITRTKEIGIRKVLGASLSNITILLSKDFVQLVFMAGIIGIPLAWWGINSWLKAYPYQTELSAALFILPVFIIIIIALITVSSQILKTARRNPVDALRYE